MYGQEATKMNTAIGQREGLIGQCNAPVQESETQYAAKALEAQLGYLHQSINVLYERLSPVMTEPYPLATDPGKLERNVSSLMAKGLVDASRQVQGAADRLQEILNRLAI